MSKGIDLIKAERLRQILDEKYDAEHDDMHIYGELAKAAATYALPHKGEKDYIQKHGDHEINNWIPKLWPFEPQYYKSIPEGHSIAERQKELAKAGALIAAEIDRLERVQKMAAANARGEEPTESERVSNARLHAELELTILSANAKDPDNRPIIEPFRNEIIALVDAFGNSGQSGGSAPYTAGAIASAIKALCLFKPIAPITGEDAEWMEVTTFADEKVSQNRRCPNLFKDKDGAYYLDAIHWRNQRGDTYTGLVLMPDGKEIGSRQYLKGFPFSPKTFTVDIEEETLAKDQGYLFHLRDISQLKPVFEYYESRI